MAPSTAAPAALLLALMSGAPVLAAWRDDGPASMRHGARRARFIPLGDLPGGVFQSRASGLSRDGQTVVGSSVSAASFSSPPIPGSSGSHPTEAFLWRRGSGMIPLGDLPGDPHFHSSSAAVSADGSVVVGLSSSGLSAAGLIAGGEGFRWTASGGMVGLGVIPNIQQHSPALAVSDDGRVIVGYVAYQSGSYQPYAWQQETGLVGLGNLDGLVKFGFARAISGDGLVIVGSDNASGGAWGNQVVAAIKTESTPWSALIAEPAAATAISRDGTVIVGEHATGAGPRAFRWTASGGMTDLEALPGVRSLGTAGTNDDAEVIVGTASNPDGITTAWVWSRRYGTLRLEDLLTGVYGFDLAGWSLVAASAVSGDGRGIVGTAINPNGDDEAFLVHLPDLTCVSDINGDGFVDGLDVAEFLSAYDSGSPDADLYPDGFVDGTDYDLFMSAFEEGC